MAGGIDEVHLVGAAGGGVGHADGGGLDGDAAFALQVHLVQHLLGHLTLGNRVGQLQHAVGQSGLAVVYMGDDTEVADKGLIHQTADSGGQ